MGRKPCCWKVGLKKGAWSSLEDKMLTNYVNNHGARDWRELPRKAGLDRCGKSCRLRWLNYLKPGIKRGYISQEEEDLIIKLHNLLGNRWSLIAGRLPGRTDNEIKNHWKTKLSKRDPKAHHHQENKNHNHQTNQTVVKARAVRCTKAINIPHPLDHHHHHHHHHHQENKNHDHQINRTVVRARAVRCTKAINIPHPLDHHHHDQENKNHDHQINQTVVRAKAVRCTKVINIPHPLDHHNQNQNQDQDKDQMVMVDQEDHQKSSGGDNNKGDNQDHHDPVEESMVDCWIRSLKQHGDLHEDSHIGAMDFKALASFLNLDDDDEWFHIN